LPARNRAAPSTSGVVTGAHLRRSEGGFSSGNPRPRVWSLYGAPWLQRVAISGNWPERRSRINKRKPLPWLATGCRRRSMVSRASAVGCHPLREVPSLRRRGSTRGPLSAGFRRALTQATHYSTIMHDLLFARASINRASLTAQAVRRRPHDQHHQQADVRQYFGPAFLVDGSSLALASPRLMNGARRPGEKTLAHARPHEGRGRGLSPRIGSQ
jgi:hypothetical protein